MSIDENGFSSSQSGNFHLHLLRLWIVVELECVRDVGTLLLMNISLLNGECVNTILFRESGHMLLTYASVVATCIGDVWCHIEFFYLCSWTCIFIFLFIIYVLSTLKHIRKQKWRLHLMLHTWIRWLNALCSFS